MTLFWPSAEPSAALPPGQVHVWAWSFGGLEDELRKYLPLLSPAESERCGRFYFLRHRIQYAKSHANLRRVLAAYLRRDPGSLNFSSTAYGKPVLEEIEHVGCHFSFNLSHTATLGLLAVGNGVEVGVDAETIRPIGPDVAESHFSVRELDELGRLRGEEWLRGFYRCWTRKEALLKAEGVGLNLPLAEFDVSTLEEMAPALLEWRAPAAFRHHWKLHHLDPASGVIAALAVDRTAQLSCFQLAG